MGKRTLQSPWVASVLVLLLSVTNWRERKSNNLTLLEPFLHCAKSVGLLIKELRVHQGWTPGHRLDNSPQLWCGGNRGEGEDTGTRRVWQGLAVALRAAWILQETSVTEGSERTLHCCWGLSHALGQGVEKGTGYLAEKLIPFLRKRWNGAHRTTVNSAMFLRGKVSFFPLNGEFNCNS